MLPLEAVTVESSQLNNLPGRLIDELGASHDLLVGLLKSQQQYRLFSEEAVRVLDLQLSKLNTIVEVLEKYDKVSGEIAELVSQIQEVYNQFTDYETEQYKLLSGTFHQEKLKSKFRAIIDNNHQESLALANSISSHGDHKHIDDQLKQFKASRKAYHLRMEKWHRWNEDRVTGFFT